MGSAPRAEERGWTAAPWYSSHGSDFNCDCQVTLDESRGQTEYNYRSEPGLRGGDRSAEYVGNTYTFLGTTALGRPEDWEEPKGRVTQVRPGRPHVHQLES